MTKAGSFLCGFLLASACAAAAWWYLAEPARRDALAQKAAAESAARRSRHDEQSAQQWAESEHRRKLELEQEVETLKRTLSAQPPRARRQHNMGGQGGAQPEEGELPPEQWDRQRINNEIMLVATAPQRLFESPRYALITRALKAHLDDSVMLLTNVMSSELPIEMKSVCALLFGALGDPRGVKPLLDARAATDDPELRRYTLRGLANLPGDEQLPVMLEVWADPAADELSRKLAIHGLARRRHEIAFAVAESKAEGIPPGVRLQALQTLHAQARLGEWKDATMLPVFGKALLSADGDRQQKISLLALEGFWSKDSLAYLDAFAEAAGTSELAVRARKAADAIRAGTPRPEGAGTPPQKSMSPVDAEPPESSSRQAEPPGQPAEQRSEPTAPK
jgi:hypothetical protein